MIPPERRIESADLTTSSTTWSTHTVYETKGVSPYIGWLLRSVGLGCWAQSNTSVFFVHGFLGRVVILPRTRYNIQCGHRIAIIRRTGEDNDGDRDCVLGVRAYGLRGKNGYYVPANQRRGEGVVQNQRSRPGIQSNNRVCELRRGYHRGQRPFHLSNAASSEGLGVLPVVQDGNLRSPGCALTVEGVVAES